MKALVIVDVQNDFLPGGSLAVAHGDAIIPVINGLIPRFGLVVATQDWHPQNHSSFASNHPAHKPFEVIEIGNITQKLWPDHCVQGSAGARFSKALNTDAVEAIFRKGTDSEIDSYSGFFDNAHRKTTGLADYLRGKGVKEVFIAGLAGDICVYFTVLDALEQGFATTLIADAAKPLDAEAYAKGIEDIEQRGGRVVDSGEV